MRKGLNHCSRQRRACAIATCCFFLLFCAAGVAESDPAIGPAPLADSSSALLPDAPVPQSAANDAVTVRQLPMNFLKDQQAIWTSPVHIHMHDMVWFVPLAGATAVAIATDHRAIRDVVSHDAQFNHSSVNASNVMLASLVAIPVVNLGYGAFGNHEHARETGLLTIESAADSAIVEQGMKLIFWRERPRTDNANGKFWQSKAGVDSSFPSSHSVFAWSTAAVIAGEYPSAWSQLTVYTLATGVSVTRVIGQEHFPSDVLVGSVVGWLVGHYVYKARHRWEQRHR